jgi:hypothetical protein
MLFWESNGCLFKKSHDTNVVCSWSTEGSTYTYRSISKGELTVETRWSNSEWLEWMPIWNAGGRSAMEAMWDTDLRSRFFSYCWPTLIACSGSDSCVTYRGDCLFWEETLDAIQTALRGKCKTETLTDLCWRSLRDLRFTESQMDACMEL